MLAGGNKVSGLVSRKMSVEEERRRHPRRVSFRRVCSTSWSSSRVKKRAATLGRFFTTELRDCLYNVAADTTLGSTIYFDGSQILLDVVQPLFTVPTKFPGSREKYRERTSGYFRDISEITGGKLVAAVIGYFNREETRYVDSGDGN